MAGGRTLGGGGKAPIEPLLLRGGVGVGGHTTGLNVNILYLSLLKGLAQVFLL